MAMEMEELDEFEVLWPDSCLAHAAHEPAASSSPPVQPPETCAPRTAVHCFGVMRSRPVDVPRAARSQRWKDGGEEEDGESGKEIVPPHLLVSGRQRSEVETAVWTLRTQGPPCKRGRDLRHLRNFVLRMTGFIEG